MILCVCVCVRLCHDLFDLSCLVSTLSCLQRDEAILTETQGRKRLEKESVEQRGLINALTAETMTLREEVAALQVRESIFYLCVCVCVVPA